MPIKLTTTEDQHFYNGYPSVTTVVDLLKEPYLERWRGKVGNEEADRIRNEAAWLGTLVHDTLTANELSNTPIELSRLDPLTQHAIAQYLEWKRNTLDYWLMLEQPLVCDELGTGGQPDRVGVLKGDECLTLVDFKTGHPSVKNRFQTAGYKILLNRNGFNVERRIVLYLPTTIEKGKKLSVKEFTNHATDESGFLNLLSLYYNIQSRS